MLKTERYHFSVKIAKDSNPIGKFVFNKKYDDWIGVSHATFVTLICFVKEITIFGFESESGKGKKRKENEKEK